MLLDLYLERTEAVCLDMSSAFGPQHVSTVRSLYKTILMLHKGLPCEMKALGDQYVKSEFKRHKDAEPQFVVQFMKEWTVSTERKIYFYCS